MASELFVGPGGYPTINAALVDAADFDTIRVAPGTYNEAINITQIIQLLGAQAGVDARTRSGAAESVITAVSGSAIITVSDTRVVIDDFTVQGNTAGPGIATPNTGSGYWILNNIIQNNVIGLSPGTNGALFTQIRQNYFNANNQPGAAGGTAIYRDTPGSNIYIDSNRFTNHITASINFNTGAQSNIIISRNQILNDNTIVLFNTTNVKITQNTILDTGGTVIFIGGGTNQTDIEQNIIQQGTNGIRVTGAPANRNIRAKDNSIDGNSTAGLNIDAASYTVGPGDVPLDATNNWWGDPAGPTGTDVIDPGGHAITTPFLTQDPLASPPGVGEVRAVARLTSDPGNTFAAATKTAAVNAALGIAPPGPQPVDVGNSPGIWPELRDYEEPNNASLKGNPATLWPSPVAAPGEVVYFSQAFPTADISQHVIVSSVFADNAHRLHVEEYDSTGAMVRVITPAGGLNDGVMAAQESLSGDLNPPFNWQKLRLYSKVFNPARPGNRIVLTVEALNYVPNGPLNPGGVSFVADVYRAGLS